MQRESGRHRHSRAELIIIFKKKSYSQESWAPWQAGWRVISGKGIFWHFFTLTSSCLLHLGRSPAPFLCKGRVTHPKLKWENSLAWHFTGSLSRLECFLFLVEFRACFSKVGVHMGHLLKMQISGPHPMLYVVLWFCLWAKNAILKKM